jgi:UDP-N-acetylglucosamine 2-epimerase
VDNKKILRGILEAVNDIKSTKILFPVHPRTRKMIDYFKLNDLIENSKVITVEPLGYFEMLRVLKHCELIITDSGGLQKEAFFAQKACITLRKSTEHLDTVRLGVNTILDPEKNDLSTLPKICMKAKSVNYQFGVIDEKPYGNGFLKIVNKMIDGST